MKEQKLYQEALSYLHDAQNYAETSDTTQIAQIYSESGIVHLLLLQTDSAYHYIESGCTNR